MAQITVACKLPNGLHLDLPGKGRITLNGFSHKHEEAPKVPIIGGYALTHGVDEDFYKEWLSRNASLKLVKDGLIFTAARDSSVAGKAAEQAELLSGLERLDPNKPGKGIEKVSVGA